ncbi:hypothetical protein ACFRI7_06280 [Streptomyces sp. NPDC056716]|uniref:hypothetical protein n=1 Tax=unclassified Streptomyces TaxID=2593676 RepID=UPI0036848350
MVEAFGPGAVVRRAWAVNRPLAGAGGVLGLITLAALVGLVVDPSRITGQAAWAKPARFAFSFALYAVTLLWLLTFVRGHRRLVRLISWVTAVAVVAEVLWVVRAAAAGTTSHFNFGSDFAGALTVTMLVVISVAALLALVTIVLLLLQRIEPPALAWALWLGLALAVVGMAVGVPMIAAPTPAQEVAADLGQGMPVVGAHTVGVADGGPGMPVTNFSTVGGDQRVAHFVGVHSLQALALLGLLLTLGPKTLGPRHRTALVWIAAATLLGLTAVFFWQAHRGQPVTAPDSTTVAALIALAVGAAAATAAVFAHARTRTASVTGPGSGRRRGR